MSYYDNEKIIMWRRKTHMRGVVDNDMKVFTLKMKPKYITLIITPQFHIVHN
jgi:hypothetical protein